MTSQELHQYRVKKITALLSNQADLNFNSYGNDWFQKGKAREWCYPTALADELQEYVRSIWTPWWSKENKFDITNARIELVDALHFLLSEILIQFGGDGKAPDIEAAAETCATNIDEVWGLIEMSGMLTRITPEEFFGPENDVTGGLPNTLEGVALLQRFGYMLGDPEERNQNVLGSFLLVFIPLVLFTFEKDTSFTKFTNLYYAKTVLNKFRQDNGYREKKYKKIWDAEGNEDNYYLTKYVASQLGEMDKAVIYTWLQTTYNGGNPLTEGV